MKVSAFGRFAFGLAVAVLSAGIARGADAPPAPLAGGYHLIKTISLPDAPGGAEYYDYITVDAAARRVYISHGAEVVVLNADDYSVVGKIGGLSRCHGVALAPKLGKGFITDGDSREGAKVQEVVIFDLKTLKVTGRVSTGQIGHRCHHLRSRERARVHL